MEPVVDAIMSSYATCKTKKITAILFIALHVFRRYNNWAILTSESDVWWQWLVRSCKRSWTFNTPSSLPGNTSTLTAIFTMTTLSLILWLISTSSHIARMLPLLPENPGRPNSNRKASPVSQILLAKHGTRRRYFMANLRDLIRHQLRSVQISSALQFSPRTLWTSYITLWSKAHHCWPSRLLVAMLLFFWAPRSIIQLFMYVYQLSSYHRAWLNWIWIWNFFSTFCKSRLWSILPRIASTTDARNRRKKSLSRLLEPHNAKQPWTPLRENTEGH